VSPDYVHKRGLDARNERIEELGDEGNTVVYLLIDDKPVGAIALADIIRKESFDAIARLKAMGIRCLMITGDAKAVAKSVAARLGLDAYFAEILPHQKVEKVREVKRSGVTVAMIGDGVNDAPALVESDVGIAIGAGTEVAVESADVVLVPSDPRDVFAIVALSRATYRKIVQNLLWATGYNIVAIPLAAGVAYPLGVLISPAVGAALMSASTIIVAINAQLLARARTLVGSTSGTATQPRK
jgi:P-type Cu2+ transporter